MVYPDYRTEALFLLYKQKQNKTKQNKAGHSSLFKLLSKPKPHTPMQKKSFYDELKYDDLITVRCAFSIEEDESTTEAMMKELVDDAGRMDKEELTALRLRLLNTQSDTKAYRTFVVSHRDPDGDLCGRTKHLHRLDQHGQLLTVGSRTKLQRESRYDPTQFRFHMWEEPQPYQKASAPLDVAPPRSVERVELSNTTNIMHPEKKPLESQVRLTLSFTNDYARNLTKTHLITNAKVITCAPANKVHIELHSLDEAYEGQVLRVITRPTEDSFAIHYFKVALGQHNHFNVILSDDLPVLKNWAPKKHLALLKKFLSIE